MSIAVAPDMYYIKWDLYSNGQISDFSNVKVQTLFSLYCNWMYLELTEFRKLLDLLIKIWRTCCMK